MKVTNMYSDKGNPVPNQMIIETNNGTYFQSYKSLIALRRNGKVYLDSRYWDYSKTTGKYRNQFLGENIKETREKIKIGIYELVDLSDPKYSL